jgi:SpoVK/Ycf46/Vps4 family AAA+-type ATPase
MNENIFEQFIDYPPLTMGLGVKKSNTTNLKSFNYLESGEITFSILDTIKTTKKLDAGVYKIDYIEHPVNSVKLNIVSSEEVGEIFEFEDKDKIDNLSKSFFEKKVKTKIKNLGLLHKFGILFHGKEGTGKSTIKKYYYNKFVGENDAIVFQIICNPRNLRFCWDFIVSIRAIQDNPIVIVFEEFDQFATVQMNYDAYMKTILDGNNSIDNCIFMASTNYIDKIPEAIKERPSRFKYVLKITEIDDIDTVNKLIKKMIGEMFSEQEVELFAKDLQGQTIDFIKQFCLDKIMDLKTYAKKKKTIGFGK